METLFYYSVWALTVVILRRLLKRNSEEKRQQRNDKIWDIILNTNPDTSKEW